MSQRFLLPFATSLALSGLSATAAAQASLDVIGPSGASRMTPDGLTVVGSNGGPAWLWTQSGGFVSIGGQSAVELSDDTRTVVGNRIGTTGFDGPALWTSGNGWQDLGGLPGETPPGDSHGTANDLSADGSVVVGLGWRSNWSARAFRWDAVNGMAELPKLAPSNRSSRANTISGDGQWIGGWDESSGGERRAALWDASLVETLFLARPENPEGIGEISSINHDGTTIAGKDLDSGFVWTQTGGLARFGPVPGVDPFMNYNWANAASEDGRVAVGGNWDLFANTTYATIWSESLGVQFLHEYLASLGVTGLDSIQLANALDVSADGTRILGWGVQFPFSFVWWIAEIPGCNGGTASFCVTSANSVGSGAQMGSNGKVSLFGNDFQLTAGPVPNQPGLFYFGSATTQSPFGDGLRCVGGGQPVHRLPVELASGNVLHHALDFDAAPSLGRILPGTTWHFQAWYRDPAAGGSGFNLSDGLTVTFCD